MFAIRNILKTDNQAMAEVIRKVMPEFGACGPGFAIHDPEVDFMAEAYAIPNAAYFVVIEGQRLIGGGGFAPLLGADKSICELRKMYFLPEARGQGVGKQLLDQILLAAKNSGFKTCYLETFHTMKQAQKLYERSGFKKLEKPMGATGHSACDLWYAIEL